MSEADLFLRYYLSSSIRGPRARRRYRKRHLVKLMAGYRTAAECYCSTVDSVREASVWLESGGVGEAFLLPSK